MAYRSPSYLSLQMPRLSGMLRAFLTERGKSYDFEKEVIKRQQQLSSLLEEQRLQEQQGRALSWHSDFVPLIGIFPFSPFSFLILKYFGVGTEGQLH